MAFQRLQTWEKSPSNEYFLNCDKEYTGFTINDQYPTIDDPLHAGYLIFFFEKGNEVITKDGLVRCYTYPLEADDNNVSCDLLCETTKPSTNS